MTDFITARDGTRIAYLDEGPRDAPVLAFGNSLGTDMRLWDAIQPALAGYRVIRHDKRGHGQSDVPEPPYTMGTLISDAEAVLDACGAPRCVFVGLSIGGMMAQGLAVKRPELFEGIVLACTAAKIGTAQLWDDRIEGVLANGMESLADSILERWFGRDFLEGPDRQIWHDRLCAVPPKGYAGCCAAIKGTDFYTPTSGLRLPCLAIAGTEDGSTPPDLVRETADLIPGSRTEIIRRAGHLPCVENPERFAEILTGFLGEIGHVP